MHARLKNTVHGYTIDQINITFGHEPIKETFLYDIVHVHCAVSCVLFGSIIIVIGDLLLYVIVCASEFASEFTEPFSAVHCEYNLTYRSKSPITPDLMLRILMLLLFSDPDVGTGAFMFEMSIVI